MSASDLITKHKLESIRNKFTTKDSSNETMKKMINTVRSIDNIDAFGSTVPKTWFDVAIPNNEFQKEFPEAKVVSDQITKPIVYSHGSLRNSIPADGKTIKMKKSLCYS